MWRLVTLGLLIINLTSYGWTSDKDTSKNTFSIITGGIGYQYISPNSIGNSGLGISATLGINVARPFTNKFSLALYATVKGREKIPQASFNTNLSSYSKANSDLSNLSPDENAIASHFINQTDKKGTIGGAAKRQLGLQFHINKPYFPTLRVYTGRTIELIETSNAIAAITNNSDWIYARYNQVGLELLYHPFQSNNKSELKVLFIGVSLEKNGYSKATLQDFNLSEFLPNFAKDHNSDYRLGIKVGLLFLQSTK